MIEELTVRLCEGESVVEELLVELAKVPEWNENAEHRALAEIRRGLESWRKESEDV